MVPKLRRLALAVATLAILGNVVGLVLIALGVGRHTQGLPLGEGRGAQCGKVT
ncbi:MAG: hypothetical protein P4L84_19055 [Isosphaeraceae bacterium]|nr:hypothetical protein [Isosphaeraceae bacterium]